MLRKGTKDDRRPAGDRRFYVLGWNTAARKAALTEFVDSQREQHGVQPVVEALKQTPAEIAPSTYYAAKSRPESARAASDRVLAEKIERRGSPGWTVADRGPAEPSRQETTLVAATARVIGNMVDRPRKEERDEQGARAAHRGGGVRRVAGGP